MIVVLETRRRATYSSEASSATIQEDRAIAEDQKIHVFSLVEDVILLMMGILHDPRYLPSTIATTIIPTVLVYGGMQDLYHQQSIHAFERALELSSGRSSRLGLGFTAAPRFYTSASCRQGLHELWNVVSSI